MAYNDDAEFAKTSAFQDAFRAALDLKPGDPASKVEFDQALERLAIATRYAERARSKRFANRARRALCGSRGAR